MTVTTTPYGQFLLDLAAGVHNLTSDTTRAALLTASYTPDMGAHHTFSDVSGAQMTGAGYTAGGQALTGKSVSYSASTKTLTLAAASASWAGLTGTFRYVVLYRSGGSNQLIGLINFGADRTYAGETFELSFPDGVVTIGTPGS